MSARSSTSTAFVVALVVFGVLFVAGIIWITYSSQVAEPTPAATPAPERLERSPTSPEGEALPPNRPGPTN